jgi:hypothetical protein
MATTRVTHSSHVTIRLDRKTIPKAKIIAARRSTSTSSLLTRPIEILVGDEQTYQHCK